MQKQDALAQECSVADLVTQTCYADARAPECFIAVLECCRYVVAGDAGTKCDRAASIVLVLVGTT